MSKHTPGPWRVGLADDTVVTTQDGDEIVLVQGDYGDPTAWPVMEANARLIAAAPELLEALQGLLQLVDELRADDPNWVLVPEVIAARAAITKATGE